MKHKRIVEAKNDLTTRIIELQLFQSLVSIYKHLLLEGEENFISITIQ